MKISDEDPAYIVRFKDSFTKDLDQRKQKLNLEWLTVWQTNQNSIALTALFVHIDQWFSTFFEQMPPEPHHMPPNASLGLCQCPPPVLFTFTNEPQCQ